MKKKLLLFVALFGGLTAFGQCLPTYNSQCTSGDFINSVVFNTISNTSTGCSTPGSNNYEDYTAMTTVVQQGTTYNIDVTPGPSWGQYFVAYIDFNHDLDFDDPNEFFDIGYANSGTTITAPIAIPMGVAGGPTVMRVMCRYGTGALTAGQGCATGLSYGETEDYTLNVSAPLNDDAGVSSFVTPLLPTCNFSDSVRVAITNYGTDTLTSVNVNWSWNGTLQTTYPWSGSLAPFGSDTVTLGLVALMAGDDLISYTTTPNGVLENAAGSWNDSTSILGLSSGLSGLYTIGGTTPDYADFASAISDLSTFGTCGSVIFDVRNGTYTEQVDLPSMPNTAANTVTFRSESGDPMMVTLDYSASGTSDNYVVRFADADFYRFENMTIESLSTSYSVVLDYTGNSDNNIISGCRLIAPNSTSTSTYRSVIYSNGGEDNNNEFWNNTIQGGSYGLYWQGGGSTASETGTVFDGNQFLDNYYYGARFYYNNGVVFNNNVIEGASTYTFRYGLYMYYAGGSPQVTNNKIYGDASSGFIYGIYLSQGGGTSVNYANITNNMVQVGRPTSTSSHYGIYLSNAGYLNVHNNSVLVTEGGSSSRAFYATSGGGTSVLNNIFANNTSGYSMYVASAFSVTESDYNVIYSPAGNAGYFSGNQATLADWQTATSFDANSIAINPSYASNFDLHVCNDSIGNQGTPVATVMMDIDGQPKDATNPDMGADEFTGLTGSFLGADLDMCVGDSVQIWAGSPSDTILWSTGDTTMSIWVNTAGVYSVTIQGACGMGNDAITVNPSALTYANYIVADTMMFCQGDSVLLSSSAMANTYAWGGPISSTSDSIYATTGGTYSLSISDGCGSGIDAVTLVMSTVPVAAFTWDTVYVTGVFTNTTTGGGNMTYAWDFGDGVTSTDQNPIHVYANTGSFIVSLTVTNGCGTMTYTDTIITAVAGIDEIENFGSLKVYPNPSVGEFQLDLELNDVMDLDIFVTNVMGQKLFTKSLSSVNGVHSEMINLSSEAAGVYYLNISSDGRQLSNKMLIKK